MNISHILLIANFCFVMQMEAELSYTLPESVYNYPSPSHILTFDELHEANGKKRAIEYALEALCYKPIYVTNREKTEYSLLNGKIVIRSTTSGKVRFCVYAGNGGCLIAATAYTTDEQLSNTGLYAAIRCTLPRDSPGFSNHPYLNRRIEQIGQDEYVISSAQRLHSSQGNLSRPFRLLRGYIKGKKLIACDMDYQYGIGDWLLENPDLTEADIREIQLKAFREIYSFAFENKGNITKAGEETERLLSLANKQFTQDEYWMIRAGLPEWERQLGDEFVAHPNRFLCKMEDGEIPNEYEEYFHLHELSQKGVFPNINSGVAAGEQAVKALVKSVYGKKAKVTGVEGGIHASRAEVKVGEETLFIRVEHLPHRHMAMYRLLYCYPGYWRSPHAESKLAAVRQGRGLVGDFDLWRAPLLDENGIPIKNSGNNLVVFLRGNTLVELRMKELWQPDRDFDLRPLARAIDKLLVEGMRKAGEPLTREQDYLKEEKKKK